nr:MAG TPA: hypothetical protein [Caudoviricetes sp.]
MNNVLSILLHSVWWKKRPSPDVPGRSFLIPAHFPT